MHSSNVIRLPTTATLSYADLDSSRVDALFLKDRVLLVSLSQKHAKALVSFIETTRIAQSWSTNKVPFLKRLPSLAKGLWVTAAIVFRHPRLFELGSVVVLHARSQTWEQQAAGEVLFIFKS